MKPKILDATFKARRTHQRPPTGPDHVYSAVVTPHGLVAVARHRMDGGEGVTQLDFAYEGRHERRTIIAYLTDNQVSRSAWVFVQEVITKTPPTAWAALLSAEDRKTVCFARQYADGAWTGSDNHALLHLIDRLAGLLDDAAAAKGQTVEAA